MTHDELVEEVARALVECHQNDRATWNDWLANGSKTARVFIESRRLEAKTVIPLIAKRERERVLEQMLKWKYGGIKMFDPVILDLFEREHGLSLDQENGE